MRSGVSSSSRRDFLKTSTAGLVLQAAPLRGAVTRQDPDPFLSFRAPALERVRIGFVGVGLQGGDHVRNFLRIDGVEIVAICDIDESRAEQVRDWVMAAGRPEPGLFTRGSTDYMRLCDRDDVDLVFNATPWRWHVPVCVEAMQAGKHTAVEVPAAYTIDGCWQLVETAESARRHCVMMENCCYGRRELAILRMVRAGLLGELVHAEGAYIHDLREIKFSDKNEGLWRLAHSISRNGNLYPTHGLGPVAQCLDINRGDQFDFLVSMSSVSRGLNSYAAERFGADDERATRDYALGDMNSSLIRTKRGRTILLQHDTTTPRPYSRINLVQGTRGTVTGYPDRLFIEAQGAEHEWTSFEDAPPGYEHPLWERLGREAEGAGHGGMDFLEDYRLVECLRRGEPMDMDVYDGAAWSVVSELSERSVSEGSRPVEFPDFTRGRFARREPLGIVTPAGGP
jgi:hypothetical protein